MYMVPLNNEELSLIFDEKAQLILNYYIAKNLFAEPDPLNHQSEVSFRAPNEHAEQWIAQAIGGKRIGAGSYPIDVLNSNETFGCDIAILTAKTLASGELSSGTSGEKSIGQQFSDEAWAGEHSLDELFRDEKVYEIAESSNDIFFKKFNSIKIDYPTIEKVFYFFLLIHSQKNRVYLFGLDIDINSKEEIGSPVRVGKGGTAMKNVVLDNFIDSRYGEVKTYKSKKRMEIRLRTKNLVDGGFCLTFDTRKNRKLLNLRDYDKDQILDLYDNQSFELRKNF